MEQDEMLPEYDFTGKQGERGKYYQACQQSHTVLMKINELSQAEGISASQFLVLAAAEKMSAILTESYLEEEAQRGRREDFEKVMGAVPDAEPEARDRIP